MKLLDLSLPTPEENLALDEALLETAEDGGEPREVLRLWESPQPVVVLGRSSRAAEEAEPSACRQLGIPILRRCSGGAAVVTGPGCLMYGVILSYELRPAVRFISEAHQHVLQILAAALRPLLPDVTVSGTSDLCRGGKKFSGNSLRCKRTHLLYHGTLLYDFPLPLVARVLPLPPRQPDYRHGRRHEDFLTNLGVPVTDLRAALIRGWEAYDSDQDWPRAATAELARSKYSQAAWNIRH